MVFSKMRDAIAPKFINKIQYHPFNVALLNGSLPQNIFQKFLEQDKLYLFDFSRALKLTAMRLSNDRHRLLFLQLAEEILSTEINLHHKYLSKPSTLKFFKVTLTQPSINKIPAVSNYTEYLLTTAQNAPVEVAVASLIPCFFIYSTLGLRMRTEVKENNPYRLWIESYSSDQFLLSTQSIIETAKELGHQVGISEEKNMITAFVTSTEFEISFWDNIYSPSCENQNEYFSMGLRE